MVPGGQSSETKEIHSIARSSDGRPSEGGLSASLKVLSQMEACWSPGEALDSAEIGHLEVLGR